MRPLIISDTGLIMVLSLQSFSWCCCCDLCGMINKLMMLLFRFSYDCYLVDSLWAIQTQSVYFKGVVSLCQCHQRSWTRWSFQNHHHSCNNPQSISQAKPFQLTSSLSSTFNKWKRFLCHFFIQKKWNIWLPKSCHRDVELQKLLVSIHKSEK